MRPARENAIEASEFLRKYPQPAVFAFQPTSFEVAETPEALQEFERNLITQVGLRAEGIADMIHATGTCTTSCCPDCDDCDAD